MKKNNYKNICYVLFKDKKGVYRILFGIEGDKINDPSLYVVGYGNGDYQREGIDEKTRKFALQNSYHSKIDSDGLVQTHFKRNGKHFGITKQKSLEELKSMVLDYNFRTTNLEKFPYKKKSEKDIIFNINPEYFWDYSFIFFIDQDDRLNKYLNRNGMLLIHNYKINTQHIKADIYVGVAIKTEKLKEK